MKLHLVKVIDVCTRTKHWLAYRLVVIFIPLTVSGRDHVIGCTWHGKTLRHKSFVISLAGPYLNNHCYKWTVIMNPMEVRCKWIAQQPCQYTFGWVALVSG